MIPMTQLVAIALAFLLAPVITWAQNSAMFPSGGGGITGANNDIVCIQSNAGAPCKTGVLTSNANGDLIIPNGAYGGGNNGLQTASGSGFFFDGGGNAFTFMTGSGGTPFQAGTSFFGGAVPVAVLVTTVASLPTCNTGAKGYRAYVTDASSPTSLGTLTGCGSTGTSVGCNGTAWVAG
jgi:hypothetical protein